MSSTLESLIQKTAFEIVAKKILDKNQIEKLLGVLSNDGVYAMWVYAKSKIENKKLGDFLLTLIYIDNEEGMLFNLFREYQEYFQKFKELHENASNEQNKKKMKKLYFDRDKEIENFLEDISQDIYKLLFVKQILERVLIYARYHAKALSD